MNTKGQILATGEKSTGEVTVKALEAGPVSTDQQTAASGGISQALAKKLHGYGFVELEFPTESDQVM